MEQRLKERLIGTAVITALAAIFLPMLIDEDDQHWQEQVIVRDVPPLPERFNTTPEIIADANINSEHLFPGAEQQTTVATNQTSKPAVTQAKPTNQIVTPSKQQRESLRPATSKLTSPKVSLAKQADVSIPKIPNTIDKIVAKPTLDFASTDIAKPSTETAWMVQVGVFGERGNAVALQTKLNKNGFAAYIESVYTNLGELTRVRIGPIPKETSAREIVTVLSKRYQLSTIALPIKKK